MLACLDEVEQDLTMNTSELVCLVVPIITTAHTGLVLVLCRLLNWLFTDVKTESQQMSV